MKKTAYILLMTMSIVSLCLILPMTRPILAQEKEVTGLSNKIEKLESRIKELEARLKACGDLHKVQAQKEGAWQNKKNWRRLETGMKYDQVRAILGEPIKTIEGVRVLWYYPNKYCGYVYFDKKGLLTGWNEP